MGSRSLVAVLLLGLAACEDNTGPGGPSRLDFAVGPPSAAVGSVLVPDVVVAARSEAGETVGDWQGTVALSLASGGDGILQGTTTVEAVAGTAIFDDLRMSEAGYGYQLVASSDGLESEPSEPFDVHEIFVSDYVTSGEEHTCALRAGGKAYCWGANDWGQLGNGTWTDASLPGTVETSERFASLTAGGFHTCGLTETGIGYCWGSNQDGQLGAASGEACPDPSSQGLRPCSTTPIAITGGVTWSKLAAGTHHTCGLTAQGEVLCWGSGFYGQLGAGEGVQSADLPTPVAGGHEFVDMDAGYLHTCGIDQDGRVYCWGSNIYGEVGDNSLGLHRYEPVPAITEERFSSVYAGGTVCHGQTCAITPDGDTWCWGRNYQSGLNGAGQFATVPTPLAGDPGLAEVAVGGYMVCGIGVDRALYCWGEGAYSRLGLGSGNSVFTPTAVLPEMSFSSVGPRNDHACAVAATGATYCWGRNNRGQLGSSSSQEGWSIPVAVWQD